MALPLLMSPKMSPGSPALTCAAAAALAAGLLVRAAAARALVQRPAALAVQREHEVVEGHESGAVADGDAGAAERLHALAEALLHVHLPGTRAARPSPLC